MCGNCGVTLALELVALTLDGSNRLITLALELITLALDGSNRLVTLTLGGDAGRTFGDELDEQLLGVHFALGQQTRRRGANARISYTAIAAVMAGWCW